MATILREIREDDLLMIMNWRMDPDITKFMSTDPKLTLEGQKKWLEKIRSSNNSLYRVVVVDDKPAGVINLADMDYDKKTTSWGYYIGEKSLRSLKLAISLELSLYEYVFDVLGFDEIQTPVFSMNDGVVKLHVACGEEIVEEVKGEVEKNGVKYDMTHLRMTKAKWDSIKDNKKFEHIRWFEKVEEKK